MRAVPERASLGDHGGTQWPRRVPPTRNQSGGRRNRPTCSPKATNSYWDRSRTASARPSFAVNREFVLLYWQIGRDILARQEHEGWGAKVIDRLAADFRRAYPDMTGLSPRNLKYMRAFGEAWPDEAIVQGPLAQITWYHNIALLEKLATHIVLVGRNCHSW